MQSSAPKAKEKELLKILVGPTEIVKENFVCGIGGAHHLVKGISHKSSFYWPHIRKDVTHFINECLKCQQNKTPNHKPYGLLQPLLIPNLVWDEISMDFINHYRRQTETQQYGSS